MANLEKLQELNKSAQQLLGTLREEQKVEKMETIRWKIMVIARNGVYFSGSKNLVEEPDEAQWFDNYDEAVERSKDIVALNLVGVTQVRLISSTFTFSST